MANAQNLPLFYSDLVPLNTTQHSDWRLRPAETAPFLAKQHALPLTIDEFSVAQRFMPIVFSMGDEPVPLALMGLNEGVNVFMDENGILRRAGYVPAYVQRYPWMLVRLDDAKDDLSLCVDPNCELVGAFDEGEPLFDNNEPTQLTKNIMEFCQNFEIAAQKTSMFVKELMELEILMPGEVSINMPGNEQPFVYGGFQMVNQDSLRELRGDQLRKMNQSGMLPLIHAHLFSLDLTREIFQLQVELGKVPNATIPEIPANA